MLFWRTVYARCWTKWKPKRRPYPNYREKWEKRTQNWRKCGVKSRHRRIGLANRNNILPKTPSLSIIYDVNLPLLGNVLKFFECFLDYRLQRGDIKACHLLPKTEKQSVPSVIVKFVYFHHKIDIYNSRMLLSSPNMLHPTNKNPIFLRERLAKNHLKVKIYAEKDKNLVTTTFNSQVKVFVKNENNNTVSKVVQSKKNVDKIESVEIKRTRDKMNVNRFSTNNNVAQQFQKTFGKRTLQESLTAYKDKPISKIANTNQTPDDSKGMWAKDITIINSNNDYFQRK